MKKLVALLVVLLLAALSASAMAEVWKAYVDRDTLNVYAEQDRESKVVKKLKGGDEVVMEGRYDSWSGIYYEDKNGEQQVGYVVSKYLSFAMPEKYCTHKWTKWQVTREATCSRKGSRRRECAVCGKEQTENLDKLPHEYGDWEVTKEATCTEEGEQERTCEVCGYTQTKAVEKVAHEYGKWTVVEEPTCTQKGERVRRCMICAYRDSQVLNKLPHEYGRWTVTKEASCTEEGERVRKCAVCGKKDTETLEMLPHEYGKWSTIREPTCTKKGKRVRTCKVCGTQDSQSIDMLPHEYQWQTTIKTTDHSAGQRSRTCTVCGYIASTESFDPAGTLRKGARGDAVREAQQLLADQGYLTARGVDGIFGGGMERALIQFQKDQGLNPDGVGWPQTLKRLNHEFGEWRAVKKLTRDTDGEYVRVCKDCGYQETRTVPAGAAIVRRQRSEEVRTIQRMLNAMGYNAGTADGVYGPKLDNAFDAFAAENGLDFVPEQLRPVDVDNLVNGWIASISDANWKGVGGRDSKVRLILTVTPEQSEAGGPEGIATYTWRLTNMGTERCRFDALLLCFGDGPDFLADNLAVVVGNAELQAGGNNSASGSFSVSAEWGEGSLNFCAVGTSVKSGATWLSNARVFER